VDPAIVSQLRSTQFCTELQDELADPEIAAEAKSVLRSLIKTIKVTPGAKRGEVELELHGELAAILAAGQTRKNATICCLTRWTCRSSARRNPLSPA
jgi:hypothetical protein